MWKLEPSERIARWREFRNSLEPLPLETALLQTCRFWGTAPFTPYHLDTATPELWPDPWTLIYENYYCDIAKCLGIIYTISLTQHKKNLGVEFRIYKDVTTGHEYNLAWFDQGKYILNLIDNEIVNKEHIDNSLKLVRSFTAVDLKLDNY